MTDQRQRRVGAGFPQLANEIGEIVFQLAGVADVASGTGRAMAADIDGLSCRPCDQRVCVHGDFRCLTWLAPEQVMEAAERALDRANMNDT